MLAAGLKPQSAPLLNTEDEVNDSKPRRVRETKSKASPQEVVTCMSAKLEKPASSAIGQVEDLIA